MDHAAQHAGPAPQHQPVDYGPPPLSHREFISASGPDVPLLGQGGTVALPSGVWRGYYTNQGVRHNVCEFNLEFSGSDDRGIVGDGVDDVGRYHMTGFYGGRRISFTKTYEARSLNVSGVRHCQNQGHSVEYRGEMVGDSLGEGFRGAWTIHSSLGNYEGQFHLWPCMEGFTDAAPDAGDGDNGGRTFEESECVVCYDRPISTRLRPCGHVALCGTCAARLNPRKCPLCRVNFSAIEQHRAVPGSGQ